MKITEVLQNSDIQSWLTMPASIYKNDSNWIPHLQQDIQKVFDPKQNKQFKEGKATRWILRDSSHQVIGRIAAFHFPKLSSGQTFKVGGIGFFECINNQDAANLLFEKACAWLVSEGCEAVDGPINFGERDAFWGLLTQNFTDMSSYRMNYNPPYYQSLFENYGFQTYFEQWCFKRNMSVPVQDVFLKKQVNIVNDPLFRVANIRGITLEQVAKNFLTVYNNAWAGISGFKQMELRQAQAIMKSMKPILDRDIVLFAYYDKQPIGFYVNIPELNEIFQYVNGDLNFWGKLKFLYYRYFGKRTTMVGLVFGVDKAYHGRGVESAMIKYCEENIVPLNRYMETIITWIGDFNPKMLKVIENLEATKYRTLITYRKMLTDKYPFERCPIIS
jgi:GNAT superfamily N-acetyltransferase